MPASMEVFVAIEHQSGTGWPDLKWSAGANVLFDSPR